MGSADGREYTSTNLKVEDVEMDCVVTITRPDGVAVTYDCKIGDPAEIDSSVAAALKKFRNEFKEISLFDCQITIGCRDLPGQGF